MFNQSFKIKMKKMKKRIRKSRESLIRIIYC